MPIRFDCPHCESDLEWGNDAAGEGVQCPYCKALITVPHKRPQKRTLPQSSLGALILGIASLFLAPLGFFAIHLANKTLEDNPDDSQASIGKTLGILSLTIWAAILVIWFWGAASKPLR